MNEVDPRALLAAERTLLAWLRTGIALIGFGFVIARIGVWLEASGTGHQLPGSGWMGGLFGLLGSAANVLAIVRYRAFRAALVAGSPTPTSAVTVVSFAVATVLLGAALGAEVLVHLF
jgi:putative membrane protein